MRLILNIEGTADFIDDVAILNGTEPDFTDASEMLRTCLLQEARRIMRSYHETADSLRQVRLNEGA